MNVLFIVDGSLSNPILLSQGIPHIQENSLKGVQYSILSFEDPEKDNERYKEAFDQLDGFSKIYSVNVPKVNIKIPINFFIRLFNYFLIAKKVVKKEKIEIVHGRSNFPSLIGLLLKIFTKVKLVYDNRGLLSDELGGKRLRILLEKFVEKLLIGYSDIIVVVSKKFSDYLSEHYKGKASLESKIRVIENSYSEKRFVFSEELRNLQRMKYGIQDRLVMVYSGPLADWQRFDLVLDTFKALKDNIKNAFLLIISYDPLIESTTKAALKDNSDYAVFNVKSSEVGKYLIMGDFGIILSNNKKTRQVSAPIKFGEYLASGLPILLMKNIGDTEEIIGKYNVGVLVEDIEDILKRGIRQIIQLTKDPDVKRRCCTAAKENLSLKSSAVKYFNIYSELSGNKW